mgnify:FL=1
MKKLTDTKISFCPGPGAVIPEWFQNQREFFGRGDKEYHILKTKTLKWLKKKSGQDEIIAVPGAATTAGIIALNTFIERDVIVIDTGYYSQRWHDYLKKNKNFKNLRKISYNKFLNSKLDATYKWVVFVYVETASCTLYDIRKVKKKCIKIKSKLFLDATASIGLEKNHNLADVLFFSSCKGLFGPTGLGFIGHKKKLNLKSSNDFLLDYKTHKESKYTLGYNCMASLFSISKRHEYYLKKLKFARNYLRKFFNSDKNNPLIGCGLKYNLKNKKKIKNTIFYIPRKFPGYDVVFFLGLIKLNNSEIISVIKKRIINNFKL